MPDLWNTRSWSSEAPTSRRDLLRRLLFAAERRESAYVAHLVLAMLFFSSFFLFGYVLAADWDLLSENYPMLLLAKREFWQGSLGLWNPYIFSGAPSSVEASTPLFFPENWPLFLLPDAFLFGAITFAAFVKMCLIGVAAYHFYCAELLNRRWALFASITYQLSGWVIWVVGTYVALSVFLYYTVVLALFWTYRSRSDLANYLLLSAAIAFMLLAGNIAHASYALLGYGVLFLYRNFSRDTFASVARPLAVFAASSATGLLLFCIQLLPTLATLHASGADDGCCEPRFFNASFLIARFFDTEILGVQYIKSSAFFENMSERFNGFHLHWLMPDFFGVVSALLVLWAFFGQKSTKRAFWGAYTVIVFGLITFTQPFDALAEALVSPVYHVLSLHFLLPGGFAATAALGGMMLERNLRQGQIPRMTVEFFAVSLVVVAMFILVIMIRNVAPLAAIGSNSARLLTGSLIF